MSTSLLTSVNQSRARSLVTHQRAKDSVYGAKDFANVSSGGGSSLSEALSSRSGVDQYGVFRNWVYVCINSISARIGGQPIRVGRIEGAEANPERRVRPDGLKIPSFVKEVSAAIEVLVDHPLLDLLASPNPVQRKRELLFMMVANLYLTGESYLLRDGEPSEDGESDVSVWAIPTAWVKPIHEGGMFSAYRISFGNNESEAKIFPAEAVSRTYFPDPANLKAALAPVKAIMTPIRTDAHIQQSQEAMFKNGIYPRIALKAGGYPSPDGTSAGDRRAVLTSSQRKQLTHTIRTLYAGVSNYGEPLIFDGIIDDIVKLSSTPEEMDWLSSGAQIKDRIFQAFGVNPIVVGAITPANKAQAVEAEKNLCSQVVNPLINAISESLTEFLGPVYDPETRLKIWIEECHPVDEDLKLKKWDIARRNEDVTRNEYRAEVLNMPPEEQTEGRSRLLDLAPTMGAISSVVGQVNQGRMTIDQGAETLMLTLQISEEQAMRLVSGGDTLPQPEPDTFASTDAPIKKLSDLKGQLRKCDLKSISLLQQGNAEKAVVDVSSKIIASQVSSIVTEMGKLESKNGPKARRKNSEDEANVILDMVFRPVDHVEPMMKAYIPIYTRMIAEGAITEAELHNLVSTGKAVEFDFSTLLEEGISPDLPDWVADAAKIEMQKIFEQPYWLKIPEATRGNAFTILNNGILKGDSIAEMARAISKKMGLEYTLARGRAIARTETSAALNAGHVAGIKHVEEETGIVTGKEWLSVLGTTTRDDHAALDGVQVLTADGLFNLGGTEVPYPSHFALPPGQRINCQCTVISTMIVDNLAE